MKLREEGEKELEKDLVPGPRSVLCPRRPLMTMRMSNFLMSLALDRVEASCAASDKLRSIDYPR